MSVHVDIDGYTRENERYMPPNRELFQQLLEAADFEGDFKFGFIKQVSAHGGGHRGLQGVRFNLLSSTGERVMIVTTQVAGNDSRYEFSIGVPANMEGSDFMSRLQKAQMQLQKDEPPEDDGEDSRVTHAHKVIIELFGEDYELYTALLLVPASVTYVEGIRRWRFDREVYSLINNNRAQLFKETLKEAGILRRVMGETQPPFDGCYELDDHLHQLVVTKLEETGYIEKFEETSRPPSKLPPSVVEEGEQPTPLPEPSRSTSPSEELAFYKSVVEENKSTLTQVDGDLERIAATEAELRAEKEAVDGQFPRLTATIEELQHHIDELERELEQKRSELESLRTERTNAKRSRHEIGDLLDKLTGERAKLESRRDRIQAETAEAEQELEDLKIRATESLLNGFRSLPPELQAELLATLQSETKE